MINLKELIQEWKTVLVSCGGMVGIAIVAFTVGIWLFGREYALCAAPPISGGIIATILTTDAAKEAGRPELATFAILVFSLQLFVGLPVASKCLKLEAERLLESGAEYMPAREAVSDKKPETNLKLIKEWPKWMETSGIIMFKLALTALVATMVSNLTQLPGADRPLLNVSIAYLIFGVLFTEIGFLERGSLQKANGFSMLMLCTLSLIPGNLSAVTMENLMDMILPLAGMLVLCAGGIALLSVVVGRLLHYSVPISVAVGMTALFGYPCTQIITEEVIQSMEVSRERKDMLAASLLPKMLIGGFTSVSVASVFFAGILVPLIF